MNMSLWFDRETWRLDRYEWSMVAVGSFAIGLVTIIAWSTPLITCLFVALPTVLLIISGRPWPKRDKLELTWLSLWGALTTAYITLSIFWSADFIWTLDALWPVYGSIAAICLGLQIFRRLTLNWLTHLCRAALVSYCICLSFALIEETADHAIKRLLFWPFQAVSFAGGHIHIDWHHISQVRPSRTNWNMTLLIFLVWPLMVFLQTQLTPSQFRTARVALLLVLIATVFQSKHLAAMVALIAGSAVFAIAQFNMRIATLLTATGWLMAFIIVVPVANMAFQHNLHLSEQLQFSSRHRIVLWEFTAKKIAEKPIFGVGAGATHPLNEARRATARRIPGTEFIAETTTHPHNIYLQALYELGIVGASLTAIFGLLIIAAIYGLGFNMNAPYLLAVFATWAAQSGFSFGFFEAWYVFAITFTICVTLAVQTHWQHTNRHTIGLDQTAKS